MTAEVIQFTGNFDAQAFAENMPPYGQMRFASSVEDPRLALQAKLMEMREMRAGIDVIDPETTPAALTFKRRIGLVAVSTFEEAANGLADQTESTVQELFGAQPSRKVEFLAPPVGRTALVAA